MGRRKAGDLRNYIRQMDKIIADMWKKKIN